MFEARIIKQLFLKMRSHDDFLKTHTNPKIIDNKPIIVPLDPDDIAENTAQTGKYIVTSKNIKDMLFEILVHRQKFSVSIVKIL